MLVGPVACAGMSKQDQDAALDAGTGAVGGNLHSIGSAVGTRGGAAVGGIIGQEVSKPQ